ncbi:MAG TPA: serine/threonine-protein kinase [Kofleriaceae bacterium]|nr:serine/threonine-protein kinase [Kofleriaceae bacterium]
MPEYKPPPRFAGYEVHELLGKGGMASVFRGEHVLLQRAVAIKFLHHSIAASEAGQRRFLREARLVAKLAHPSIVTVFDVGQLDDGTYYQASELVPGVTLREHLRRGPLEPARALGFARQLAEGLASAHAMGVIHRDLKPSNVMVVPDPALPGGLRVKLLDFGIAKSLAATSVITKIGAAIGTPGYMAPEQYHGGSELGPASDIYSLGVVLYVMLCGAPPFPAQDGSELRDLHLSAPPPRPSARCGCAPAIDELVLRCLAKSPAARPASMAAVIAAIDAILAGDAGDTGDTGDAGAPRVVGRAVPPLAVLPANDGDGPRTVRLPANDGDGPRTLQLPANDGDGPRTLLLPAEPMSGEDPSTTTVPRPTAGPLRRTRARGWALPATAAALVLAVIALASWGSREPTAERASAPAPAPAAPASPGTAPAAPAPAALAPAPPAASPPAAAVPLPATAAPPTEPTEPPTAAPPPATARTEPPPRERATSRPRKPAGRASARPAPPSREPPPPPAADRSFERPVF